jgi:Uma2 family endonuclease
MAIQPRYGQRWTVEQYLEMERDSPIRHEYIDGIVYAMAGGTRRQNRVGRNATRLLDDYLGDGPCQVYTADMKVRLANERDHVYPDVGVTCDPRDLEDEAPDYISCPRLVIEVLSESTEAYDRGAKFDLYRGRDTLQEYVLIETDHSAIEVRSRNDDASWTTVTYGPDDRVALHSIGLTIPVAAFYRGVRF